MIGSAHRRALGGLALALALGGLACKSARIRGPEELRDRYLAALKSNDPDAAYALLAGVGTFDPRPSAHVIAAAAGFGLMSVALARKLGRLVCVRGPAP